MIVVPPKNIAAQFAPAGSRCNNPVCLVDLYPTLVDLCDIEAPVNLDGESLLPILRDPEKKTGRIVATLFGPGNVSLRDERFRYIRYADGSEELYDIKVDPNEWNNLATDPNQTDRIKTFAKDADRYGSSD